MKRTVLGLAEGVQPDRLFQGVQLSRLSQNAWALGLGLGFAVFAGSAASGAQELPGQTTDQTTCSDPLANCRPASGSGGQGAGLPDMTNQYTIPGQAQAQTNGTRADGNGVYVDSAGLPVRRVDNGNLTYSPPDPLTDLQKLAQQDVGELLPVFGRDLFQRASSTFAPGDRIPASPDYIVGPGDQILVRLSGPESLNSQLTVDTSGAIFIPKVGVIQVAGLRFNQLQKGIGTAIDRVFHNYSLSVDLGQLRSIQVYVVGEARRPGAYTVSSLSTVLNVLFVSGGPNARGSLRHIAVRRAGQAPAEFDLYDLVLRGDQTHDIRLQQGDTIFIPATGPQVALGGSVRHPAIYEIKDETTLERLLDLAGGFSATASRNSLSLDRIDADNSRQTLSIKLDQAGKAMPLRDGDVVFAGHISAGFEQTVTIRGNLANPGRFPWHTGMKLSDIIPDRKSLLTNDYWRERNRLGVPTPLFEPAENGYRAQGYMPGFRSGNGSSQIENDYRNDSSQRSSNQINADGLDAAVTSAAVTGQAVAQANQTAGSPGFLGVLANETGSSQASTPLANPNSVPDTPAQGAGQGSEQRYNEQAGAFSADGTRRRVPIRIGVPAPEIDWSYAVIERLDPLTLRSSLVPFNLGRLVKDHDATQDLVLQPGDVVTILSQADIHVPQDEQTKYVRLEGEFPGAGVYSVGPDETLDQLVRRAGGFSAKSYLYGSSFFRESARVFQQQRLDEYISTLSTDMEREAAVRAASSASGVLDPNALLEQRSLVAQLRQVRATGRVVLEFQPDSKSIDSVPHIPLENGDVFRVPSRPNTVSVIGSVYGQNVFLYNPGQHLEGYITLAGKPNRVADGKHAFIIRADGSIFSRDRAQGVFSNSFDLTHIYPGDAIVIPEKLVKPTILRQLLDYSQILSSFGLAAAAINVVRSE